MYDTMSPQEQEQHGRLREILPPVEVKVPQVQAVVEDGGDGGEGTETTCIIRTFALTLRSTTVEVCTLGASLCKYVVQDGNDIVLGHKSVKAQYESGVPLGVSVSHKNWTVQEPFYDDNDNDDGIPSVRFTLTLPSPDSVDDPDPGRGPGCGSTVRVSATYSLRPSITTKTGTILRVEFAVLESSSNNKTVTCRILQNLSPHSHVYFNLATAAAAVAGDDDDPHHGILGHTLCLQSDAYCPVDVDDDTSTPTNNVRSVALDPAMDFRQPRTLRRALQEYGTEMVERSVEQVQDDLQHRMPSPSMHSYGFDHQYVVRPQPALALPQVAVLSCPTLQLTVRSNAPGIQVSTANDWSPHRETADVCNSKGKDNAYNQNKPWSGISLEPQHIVPDSGIGIGIGETSAYHQHIVEYNVEQTVDASTTTTSTSTSIIGSDTEGNAFTDIDEMWQVQDLENWYRHAKDYYEANCSSTIEGVLGGIGWISDMDLSGSRAFLSQLDLPIKSNDNNDASSNGNGGGNGDINSPSTACEVGAGIGRVTKGLLLDVCDRCDLVESSARLLSAAPEYIGSAASSKCRYYCSELQDWQPSKKYTVVWIQWVLCYLTDADIVTCLRRCGESLVPGGVVILKENCCQDETFCVDVDDASVTRSLPYWQDLIYQAGLRVVRQTWQEDFPEDIFPVPMLALQPRQR